ncbi:uncharacterized protein PHALS_13121 [Plasmopara halstedii]|uniref:Uncharacterized protein n=1 Tax=Plasmopara halstedii TaxID=4781 RepID=A0A0P1AP76_PLAHL|nr:uncharacterized protein PHALS_13121 [Plasmopara halstedii]CEG42884.1 hypothetical protein PHALS_13121 [Plasmopara halstedii]|eukprot:XP_024579253.1 hypothetical protein PHALS_13121 [Plasmopara halstedii]
MRMTFVQLRMRQTDGLAVYDFDSLRVAQIDGNSLEVKTDNTKVSLSKISTKNHVLRVDSNRFWNSEVTL